MFDFLPFLFTSFLMTMKLLAKKKQENESIFSAMVP